MKFSLATSMSNLIPGPSNSIQPPDIPEWYRSSRLSDPAFSKAVHDEEDLTRRRIEKSFKYSGPNDLQFVTAESFAKTFCLRTTPKSERTKRLDELKNNPSVPRGHDDVSLLFYHALETCLEVFSRRFVPSNVADLENKPFFITTVYPFVFALQQRSQRPDRSLDFLDSRAPDTYAEKWANWPTTYFDLDNPDWKQRTDQPAVEYAAETAIETANAFLRELYSELHPVRQTIKHIFREVSAMVLPITFERDGITKAIASPRAQLTINHALDGLEELTRVDQPTLDEACETASILNALASNLLDCDDSEDVAIRKYISSRAKGIATSAPRYCLLPVFPYPAFLPIDPLCMGYADISATTTDQPAPQENQLSSPTDQNQEVPVALPTIQEGQSELDRAARYFIRRISQVMGLEQGVLESQFKAEVSQICFYLRKVDSSLSLEGLISAKQNLEHRLFDFDRARAEWGPDFDWDGQRTVLFDNVFDDLAKLLGETAKSEDKPIQPVLTYSEPSPPPKPDPKSEEARPSYEPRFYLYASPDDMALIESHFNNNGYVLNFGNTDFDRFTSRSIGVPIQTRYGGSKGKSLARFFETVRDDEKIVKLCEDLLNHEDRIFPVAEADPANVAERDRIRALIAKVRNQPPEQAPTSPNPNAKRPVPPRFSVSTPEPTTTVAPATPPSSPVRDDSFSNLSRADFVAAVAEGVKLGNQESTVPAIVHAEGAIKDLTKGLETPHPTPEPADDDFPCEVSQEKAASDLRVDVRTIRNWENGTTKPRFGYSKAKRRSSADWLVFVGNVRKELSTGENLKDAASQVGVNLGNTFRNSKGGTSYVVDKDQID